MPVAAPDTRPDPSVPPLPPCIALDAVWEHFAARGATALGRDALEEARACSETAVTLAEGFSVADPRYAASLGNLAACEAMGAGAEHRFAQVLDAWTAASSWVDRMSLAHSARSSHFHLRLERKHAGGYETVARDGYRKLLGGGRATTLNNLANRLAAEGRSAAAEDLYREAIALRQLGLGARDLGLKRMLENLARLLLECGRPDDTTDCWRRIREIETRGPLAPVERWEGDRSPRFSDARRLLAAVYFSPVLSKR